MCRTPCRRATARRACSRSASPGRRRIWRLAPVEDRQTGTVQRRSAPTSVSLFDQGLIQVLQASVTGLEPKQPYVLALAHDRDGDGPLQPLAAFMTNPAGSAIVNAIGPIRQIVHGEDKPSGAIS